MCKRKINNPNVELCRYKLKCLFAGSCYNCLVILAYRRNLRSCYFVSYNLLLPPNAASSEIVW